MSRTRVLLVLAVLAGVAAPSRSACAQSLKTRLGAPTKSSPHEFTRVHSVAELPDGRVIVSDPRGRTITLLSQDLEIAGTIGRRGQGPGEYVSFGAVFHLRADTAVIEEPSLNRWRLVTPTSLLGAFRSERRPAVNIGLAGVDSQGRTVEVHPHVFAGPTPSAPPVPIRAFAESLALVRRSRDGATADTLAMLKGGFLGVADVERTVQGIRMRYYLWHPLKAEEQAVVFPDGWIAVVRIEPYRVEWILPDRTERLGPNRESARIPMTSAMKQFAIDSRQSQVYKGVFRASDFQRWPETLPPFTDGAVLGMANGHVLVRRELVREGDEQVYDEFDRRGVLLREVAVPGGTRIVGSGERGFYVASADADDLEAIALHPWPASRVRGSLP